MEALQLLKFMRKKERLSFTAGWKVDVDELTSDRVSKARLDDLLAAQATKGAKCILTMVCDSDVEEDGSAAGALLSVIDVD
jgi:hypothetical protein